MLYSAVLRVSIKLVAASASVAVRPNLLTPRVLGMVIHSHDLNFTNPDSLFLPVFQSKCDCCFLFLFTTINTIVTHSSSTF